MMCMAYSGLWEKARNRFLQETYALPLDVFRILVGFLGVAYFLRLLLEVEDFSSPDGLLDHALLYRLLWFTRLSVFFPGLGVEMFYGFYALGCLGGVAIALGYHCRLWATILFIITVSHYRWNFIVLSVDDSIMHLLFFWLVLLPVGQTLTLRDYRQRSQACWHSWRQCTVPGVTLHCFLGNIALIYVTAGLCKLFQSEFWRHGFALYAILRQPIAYAPDYWGPQHLFFLQIGTYLSLIIEPLLPWLLMRPPRHPAKWFGLLCQIGFHGFIIATIRVPFANLALIATAVLFFRHELMRLCGQDKPVWNVLPLHFKGRLALIFLILLSCAMMRGIPVIGQVHKPAFALLWAFGMAQDYQLFKWVDTINYHVQHHVTVQPHNAPPQDLPANAVFPSSMRGSLLQAYIHKVPWMLVPRQYRQEIRASLLARLAQRFCRHSSLEGTITAWSTIQRIRPENVALSKGQKRLVLEWQCRQEMVLVCRSLLSQRPSPQCNN